MLKIRIDWFYSLKDFEGHLAAKDFAERREISLWRLFIHSASWSGLNVNSAEAREFGRASKFNNAGKVVKRNVG